MVIGAAASSRGNHKSQLMCHEWCRVCKVQESLLIIHSCTPFLCMVISSSAAGHIQIRQLYYLGCFAYSKGSFLNCSQSHTSLSRAVPSWQMCLVVCPPHCHCAELWLWLKWVLGCSVCNRCFKVNLSHPSFAKGYCWLELS